MNELQKIKFDWYPSWVQYGRLPNHIRTDAMKFLEPVNIDIYSSGIQPVRTGSFEPSH